MEKLNEIVKKEAEDLVNEFRMILMNEDTDCGNEILCTSIAVKMVKITVYRELSTIRNYKIITWLNFRCKHLKGIIEYLNEM